MNEWVFWIGFALIVAGLWLAAVERHDHLNPLLVAGVLTWTMSGIFTLVAAELAKTHL